MATYTSEKVPIRDIRWAKIQPNNARGHRGLTTLREMLSISFPKLLHSCSPRLFQAEAAALGMSYSDAVTIVPLATHSAYPGCSAFDSRCPRLAPSADGGEMPNRRWSWWTGCCSEATRKSLMPTNTYSGEAMNNAFMSAIAALAGSAIGAVASFATTWLTQHAQDRAQRFAQAMTCREQQDLSCAVRILN
jgi:hypothetical protein